ncbi:hypothetical protein BDA96_05G143700 [Sorghum bicolor]|jgi:hypothetical protein|uniref:Uncharacterized protein n=2 Tax=Sorghum bicolor TaxID=4558 RepID=A0A921QZ75_SORBI|nr:hypothetical protein BDA96_05G143700 [Sorghum bicolor]OQU83528.1 hypothetical protein SORBI_3005G130550 [Sorghum bicolor]
MAAGAHRSRIRCLALVRIVASVVALAFAATVVVVVLTAGLSPDNVRISITHGHLQSAGLLWSSVNFTIEHLRRPRNDTVTFYTPAKDLTVWVSMDAHDPAGRATNVCVDGVHILDLPHAPSFEGMVDIATVNNTVATGKADKPCARWRNPGLASMQLDRWVTFDDPLMLCYISQKYGGLYDFTVMLKVDMTILYRKEEDRDTTAYTDTTHYCWPVTLGNSRRISSEAVSCKPSHAFDYASIAPVLSLRDHLTPSQRRICSTWGRVPLN